MKLVLIFAISLIFAASASNPGLKIRITKLTLQEIVRMSKQLIGSMEDLKKIFKNQMKTMMEAQKLAGVVTNVAKVKDIDLISYSVGEIAMGFEAPNVFKASHSDLNFKFQFKMKLGGKTGTVTADVGGMNSAFGLAISSKDGKFQFSKAACELSVASFTLIMKGFGAEKDKEYTKNAQAYIDDIVPRMSDFMCPPMDMMMAIINMKIMESDCNVEMPYVDGMKFSLCLTESPKATSDYMEFALSGGSYMYSDTVTTVPADYSPAPLTMSDDGVSKMLYLWEAEAMKNYLLKTLFEHQRLVIIVTEETSPEFAAKIKKRVIKHVKELGGAISENAEITTTFKAAEAPTITLSAANPKEVLGNLKLRIIHDIKDGGAESTLSGLFDIQAKLSFDIKQAKEGKMLPKFTAKTAIEKLTVVELSKEVPEEYKAKQVAKAKKELSKAINKMLKKMCDKWNKLDDVIEDKYKILQVTAFDINVLDKTIESSGSVKFDILKAIKLQNKMLEKRIN